MDFFFYLENGELGKFLRLSFLGWDFFYNFIFNYLCVLLVEILKVLFIEIDLVGILGFKDEWINNFVECCWICDNVINIFVNGIENEMLYF